MPLLPAAQIFHSDEPLDLEFGGRLPELDVAYETWGSLNKARDNAVLIVPAFSAHSHARSGALDEDPGWWEKMIGPGAALNSDRWFFVCASLLGGCHGTTGPQSQNPETNDDFGGDFPVVDIRDMTHAHARLLDFMGIHNLHAVVGSSMGAMQALEFSILYPDRAKKIVAVSGTAWTRPATAAIRHLGRRAIMSDPAWKDGHYRDKGPTEGIRLARELGTVFYRSKEEFNDRFPHRPIRKPSLRQITFDVQSYLDYQGRKATNRFDANAYLMMSLAMDLHDIARDRGDLADAFADTHSEFLVAGVKEDRLIPLPEQIEVRDALEQAGKKTEWHEWSSPIGHDAFLVEIDTLGPHLNRFLES
ncbi:MAG: homoserine O-acetyltransferase [Planctomycetota bacterium]